MHTYTHSFSCYISLKYTGDISADGRLDLRFAPVPSPAAVDISPDVVRVVIEWSKVMKDSFST